MLCHFSYDFISYSSEGHLANYPASVCFRLHVLHYYFMYGSWSLLPDGQPGDFVSVTTLLVIYNNLLHSGCSATKVATNEAAILGRVDIVKVIQLPFLW